MKKVTAYFEALHQIPELSEQEVQTSSYIFKALEDMGYTPKRIGATGVYADLICDESLPWLLFRADIDGLAITEESDLSYASRHEGCMHACGHDGHTAMLLAAAAQLRSQKLPQNIRFVFQPAEENVHGAINLIENGILDTLPTHAFAMHLWPKLPLGALATRSGPLMASGDVFRIYCHGHSVHCAQRQKGKDALLAAVQIANSLPELEALGKEHGTLLFCGSMQGGTTHNIVANEAWLWGTLRTYSSSCRIEIKNALEATVEEIGNSLSVKTEIEWESSCPVVENDSALIVKLNQLFPALDTQPEPTLAAEDFAYYQAHCPGAMLWLGLGDTDPLHSKTFVVPKEVLPFGVDAWVRIANHKW